MDLTPRKLIHLAREGFEQDVLKSVTIWLCVSCYSCTVECPKQIKVTDVMYQLKQRAIRQKVYPRGFPLPVVAREFFNMVFHYGRISESWLVIRVFGKQNWFKFLTMPGLGWNLLRTGRFSLHQDKIKDRSGLQKQLTH